MRHVYRSVCVLIARGVVVAAGSSTETSYFLADVLRVPVGEIQIASTSIISSEGNQSVVSTYCVVLSIAGDCLQAYPCFPLEAPLRQALGPSRPLSLFKFAFGVQFSLPCDLCAGAHGVGAGSRHAIVDCHRARLPDIVDHPGYHFPSLRETSSQ